MIPQHDLLLFLLLFITYLLTRHSFTVKRRLSHPYSSSFLVNISVSATCGLRLSRLLVSFQCTLNINTRSARVLLFSVLRVCVSVCQHDNSWTVMRYHHEIFKASSYGRKGGQVLQESCAIAKMAAQCALHMGALKIFGTQWLRPRPLFPIFS